LGENEVEGKTKSRPFRGAESLAAELTTRNMLPEFLRIRGFDVLNDNRISNGQTITALTPDGRHIVMRVRLCWNRQRAGKDSGFASTYSATQVLAKVKNGDWVGSLEEKVKRERSQGRTHLFLFRTTIRAFCTQL
jgi:5-methylcytosine-specific restriction protein A